MKLPPKKTKNIIKEVMTTRMSNLFELQMKILCLIGTQ